MLVIWGFPYGLIGGYDLLQGQGYLPSDSPLISQIVPNWLPQVWFIVGVIAIIWATFEDAYRITRKRQNDVGTISHLISLVREADKFSITSVRNNSADVDIDTAIQEAVKWTIKAISEVEARLETLFGINNF